MTKTYQIKINQGKDAKALDIPQAGSKGQAVTVKAVSGARYQLIDPETGFGPENIRASRQGKDLKVSFEGSKTTDLVIEDYYTVTADNFNGLIGEAESGKFYEYIPENASGMASVPMLADAGQVVGMALGGAEVAPAGAAVGVLAAGLFSPWLLGAGALGLAAAGGGGGGGAAATTDTTAPTGQTGALSPVTGSDSAALGDNKTNVPKPTITGKAEAGSTVEVSFVDPAGKVTGPYKTTADANGNYSLVVPDNLADTSTDTKVTQYTPVIKATDASGNSSTANGTPFVVDTQAATVPVQIDADSNNDGYINSVEKASGTNSATLTLDKTKMVAGDVITVSDGTTTKTVTLTDSDISAGKVVTTGWTIPGEGQVLTLSAFLKDLAGNVSSLEKDSATVNTLAPNGNKAVGLKVDLDGNSDGTINGSEKGVASTTSLTATFESTKVAVGDKVTFSDGNKTDVIVLTATDVAAGKVVSTAGWALPAEDASKTFTAVISNSLGSTTPKAEQTIKLDAVSESLKTVLTIDPITGDNIYSISEQTPTTVTVTGKVSGTFAAGDLVTLTINGKTFTASVDAKGVYSKDLSSADLKADADTLIEGRVTGSNGGQLATAAQSYVVETQNTAGKTTGLIIDAITTDNILNIAETTPASVNITGKVTGKFATGDMVNLLINGVVSSGAVKSDGTYIIAVDKNDLLADGDTTVDATVTGTGGTSAKAMQNYGFDILVPTNLGLTIDVDNGAGTSAYVNDEYINSAEKNSATTAGKTSLTASFDPSKVSVGDVITFSDGSNTDPIKLTLTADMVAAGKATSTSTNWSLPSSEGGSLIVNAVLTDAAGNSSGTAYDEAKLDTVVMSFGNTTRKETGAGPYDLSEATFKLLDLDSVFEAGNYKLHLGSASLIENSTTTGHFDIAIPAALNGVAAKDVYLEFWDMAGNYSTAYLKSVADNSTYNILANAHFIL
jgi:co-chaperonin GroES (HSP10)